MLWETELPDLLDAAFIHFFLKNQSLSSRDKVTGEQKFAPFFLFPSIM